MCLIFVSQFLYFHFGNRNGNNLLISERLSSNLHLCWIYIFYVEYILRSDRNEWHKYLIWRNTIYWQKMDSTSIRYNSRPSQCNLAFWLRDPGDIFKPLLGDVVAPSKYSCTQFHRRLKVLTRECVFHLGKQGVVREGEYRLCDKTVQLNCAGVLRMSQMLWERALSSNSAWGWNNDILLIRLPSNTTH